jgi:hypothetical protein
MANPNIVSASAVYGKTTGQSIGTSESAIVTNSSSSGKIYKINTLIISNVDGTNVADVTVRVFKGSTAYSIAYTVPVPADAALVVISRDNQVYLQENDSLRLSASASSDLQAVCSWEEIN